MAAFAGDSLHIDLKTASNKKAKISHLSLAADTTTPLLAVKQVKTYTNTISAEKSALYSLVITNTSSKPISYILKHAVTPVGKRKAKIGYKVQKDTTYGYQTTTYRNVSTLETVPLQKEKFYLNSASNALLKGGKNRITFPINLPQGTQEWYYIFTASREEQDIKGTLAGFNLAAQLTKYVDDNTGLQQAVAALSPPPGAHICDTYVINDEVNAKLFKEKEAFTYSFDASRENFKSGIVAVKSKKKAYLGLRNPDNLYGIHVSMEILAVVEKLEKRKEIVQIPIITSYQIPYLTD